MSRNLEIGSIGVMSNGSVVVAVYVYPETVSEVIKEFPTIETPFNVRMFSALAMSTSF